MLCHYNNAFVFVKCIDWFILTNVKGNTPDNNVIPEIITIYQVYLGMHLKEKIQVHYISIYIYLLLALR